MSSAIRLRVVYGGWGTQRDVPIEHILPEKFNLVGFKALYKPVGFLQSTFSD